MYYHFQAEDSDEDVEFHHKMVSEQCHAVKDDGSRCKNRVVIGHEFCWIHTRHKLNLQIKDSNITHAGKGLFAYGPKNEIIFHKGDRICKYSGEVIDKDELEKRYGDYTAPYGVELHKGLYEDGSIERGIGSLSNHSHRKSKVNARLSINKNNNAQLIAVKNIKGGDEILINYGREYKFDEDIHSTTNYKKSHY